MYRRNIVDDVIYRNIHKAKVLDVFDDNGDVFQNNSGQWFYPLKMHISNYNFDFPITMHSKGRIDGKIMANSFENAYRDMMSKTPNNGQILSKQQMKHIVNKGPSFISPKCLPDLKMRLDSFCFFHVPGDICWLNRGHGRIKVQLHKSGGERIGDPREIKVYSSQNAFLDIQHMAWQMMEIIIEQISGHPALQAFDIKKYESYYRRHANQAKSFLLKDIRSDSKLIESFEYTTEEGKRIVIDIVPNRKQIKLDIIFDDTGVCYVDNMVTALNNYLRAMLTDNKCGCILDQYGLLAEKQLDSARYKLAPMMVKAIQVKRYTHPYSSNTKNKLMAQKDTLLTCAEKLGVHRLALIGTVADEYEIDLVAKLREEREATIETMLNDSYWNMREMDPLISETLGIAIASAGCVNPTVGLGVAGVKVTWDSLEPDQKNKLVAASYTTGWALLTTFEHWYDSAAALIKESANKNEMQLWLGKIKNTPPLDKTKAIEINKAAKDMYSEQVSENLVTSYYLTSKIYND